MKLILPGRQTRSSLALIALALSLSMHSRARAQAGEAEVTPEVQRLYAEAHQASQNGDEPTAIELTR